MPTVIIDKTDGFQLFLSKESIDVEVFTAKCSEINVCFDDVGKEMKERAISEQMFTKVVEGELVTTVVQHKG